MYAATYTINYVMDRPWQLGHLWSLAVEEQFYALWPLTIFLFGRRSAFWAAGAVLLVVPLIRIVQPHVWPSHRLGITEEFHTIADCIAVGCLLAGLRDWLWSHEQYRRFITSWQFWLAPLAAAAGVFSGIHPSLKWLVGIPVFNIAIAVCIDRWTRFPNADVIGKVLNLGPLTFVGVLSYSLYLWQQPFMDHFGHHFFNRFPFNDGMAFVAALVSYYLIEKTFLALRYKTPRPVENMTNAALLPSIPSDPEG